MPDFGLLASSTTWSAGLVLEALRPAAIELSLAAAEDMLREAERLETHWKQRLERARFQAEAARRQFDAAEPENSLVARGNSSG